MPTSYAIFPMGVKVCALIVAYRLKSGPLIVSFFVPLTNSEEPAPKPPLTEGGVRPLFR